MPESSNYSTVIAFDFGTRQIGMAIGQTLTRSANPLQVIKAKDGQPDWTALLSILDQWQPALLIVGLPLNMDGSESEFCLRTRKFARRLHGRTGIKVAMVDERLTTREAKGQSDWRSSYREAPIDDMAAKIILESWFNDPDSALKP
jgi:putative Holliday junction resolvase